MRPTRNMADVQPLLVTGSTRRLSTNTAALHTALELLNGHATAVYDQLQELPAFNPDDDHEALPLAVCALRALIADADAVIFCTPEYAGTLPGSFKNLLDWTGGGEIYGNRRSGDSREPGGGAREDHCGVAASSSERG